MKSKHATVPYVIWMVIFTVIPLILVAFFACSDSNGNFTLSNFINVGKYSSVFIKSIYLGGVSTLICLLIGYPMAYFISKISAKYQSIIIVLVMLPMWMNFLLRTYALMTLLEYNGLINNLLGFFNIGPLNLINTQGAVVFGMVYNFLPYMILPIYSIIIKIDKRIIEAAEDLGAGKRKVLLKVLLPLSFPGIVSGVTMVFVPAVSSFIISKMLGGGANILIGDLIEMQFLGSSYNPHLGSAISFVLMILILICIGIMNQFNKENDYETGYSLM